MSGDSLCFTTAPDYTVHVKIASVNESQRPLKGAEVCVLTPGLLRKYRRKKPFHIFKIRHNRDMLVFLLTTAAQEL